MKYITKFISLAAVSCLTTWCVQARIITGNVKNDYGNPLNGAIIKAVDSKGYNIAYATSKSSGQFTLNIPDTISHCVSSIVVSHRDYESEHIPFAELNDTATINLSKPSVSLKEIVVTPSPIRAKGDTVIYNVDAMRLIGDKSIADVISHLPGISIDPQGNISYQGETINKFYIEDFDMLGGRYSIAANNIRADDVASVSVYENHQPVKALKDISLSDKAAINLTLKKRAMLLPVGYAEGGAGTGNNDIDWRGELYTMLIHPASQTFITAKGSNFGSGYSMENTLRYSIANQTSVPLEDVYQQCPISMPPIPSSRFTDLTSQSYSATTGFKLGNNNTISADVNYTNDKSCINGSDMVDYTTGVNSAPVTLDRSVDFMKRISSLNAGLTFENNSNNHFIKNSLLLSATSTRALSGIVSSSEYNITQNIKKNRFSVTDLFNATVRNGNKIWNLYASFSFASLPKNSLSALWIDEDIFQYAKAKRLNIKSGISRGHFFNVYHQVGLSLNINYDLTEINTCASVNGAVDNDLKNGQHGSTLKIDLGPYWQFTSRKFVCRIEIPTYLDIFRYSHLDQNIVKKGCMNDILFDVGASIKLNYNISKYLKSTLSLRKSSHKGDLVNYITSPIFNSYRGYTSPGTGVISSSSLKAATISLSYRNVLRSIFGNVKLSAMHNKSNVNMSTRVSQDENISIAENIPTTRKIFSLETQISKIIGCATLKAGINGSAITSNHIVNSKKLDSKSSIWSFNLESTISTLSRNLSVSPKISYDIASTKIDGNKQSSNSTGNLKASMKTAFSPLKMLEISAMPYFYSNQLPNSSHFNTFFLDMNAQYTLNKFQFNLAFVNITNVKKYEIYVLTPLMKSMTSTQLKGFEFLLSVKYSF